mmetsp:Transcript_16899/g.43129  ORF Transcript_16899/g.43129 Transcript_16899/m.43129 type:complete len:235 (-) Transcript_16899:100-804(-)|eukprot:CAMPEP_0177660542 /NCGR_PEP_ID=MMETSP0447-20121125/18101_1 /TAXON_ID=0 /ORGANISM="Stygamoeba regulata, Strain BSH-02190019" /LENGTH=234 /DNA_ID=CAMNT_0019165625 /DNA_START=98 /DNA_END=802 /DNA_ORIENTATION=-
MAPKKKKKIIVVEESYSESESGSEAVSESEEESGDDDAVKGRSARKIAKLDREKKKKEDAAAEWLNKAKRLASPRALEVDSKKDKGDGGEEQPEWAKMKLKKAMSPRSAALEAKKESEGGAAPWGDRLKALKGDKEAEAAPPGPASAEMDALRTAYAHHAAERRAAERALVDAKRILADALKATAQVEQKIQAIEKYVTAPNPNFAAEIAAVREAVKKAPACDSKNEEKSEEGE